MGKVLFVLALSSGALIAYLDSRPGWDDTGVTALALLLSCGLLGAAGPRRTWAWALAVGLWVPALGITLSGNFGSLLALPFAFAGAYAGAALRRGLLPA